jgi:23S rRNA (uracil1939-C5)-methyltransferase
MVCFVCRGESFKGQSEAVKALSERFPEVKSVILNVNPDDTNVVLGKKCITLFGKGYIEDELCGLRFKIDPLSFYQVNHDCTEQMYRLAAEMAEVKPSDTLVDLFCGIGTIGLCVSSIAPVKRLIGVEVVPEAIENAKENAALNGISNAEFYCSAAEDFDFGEPDVLIVDPPRKGLAPSLIDTIGRVAPKRIVYISCSPDTLARDCSMLDKFGYKVLRCRPVNMFPRTSHIESVVCLSRK